jgi:peptidyl-prolyl cis-trans isomerase A (cyclophilin A)
MPAAHGVSCSPVPPNRSLSGSARLLSALLAALLGSCSQVDGAELGSSGQTLRAPSLAQALDGMPVRDAIAVELNTSEGVVHCALTPARTPRAVALFVGLARGRATWRDKRSAHVTQRPMYRDLPFFRAIANGMVQTGCPIGNGTGHPGYRIPVESTAEDASRLTHPGALLLARYRPAPNRVDPDPPPPGDVIGSQFVVTLTSMSHLAGQVSVIGACRDLTVVARIAQRVSQGESARLQDVAVP